MADLSFIGISDSLLREIFLSYCMTDEWEKVCSDDIYIYVYILSVTSFICRTHSHYFTDTECVVSVCYSVGHSQIP